MKKIMTILAVTGAISIVIANDEKPEAQTEKYVISYHQLNPCVKALRHREEGYNYDKFIGGIAYNYYRSSGLNFNSYAGYSIYKDKSYFDVDWGLKYLFNLSDNIDLYPKLSMASVSHFDTTEELQMFQIYRSTFDGALGVIYKIQNITEFDFSLGWFKDLATTCILHRGNDFWGKNYYSPYGLKASLDIRFLSIISKPIEIGAFYAQTVKDCYKEYGLRTSVNFGF